MIKYINMKNACGTINTINLAELYTWRRPYLPNTCTVEKSNNHILQQKFDHYNK
jgi:hypothetical protein